MKPGGEALLESSEKNRKNERDARKEEEAIAFKKNITKDRRGGEARKGGKFFNPARGRDTNNEQKIDAPGNVAGGTTRSFALTFVSVRGGGGG